MNNVIYLDTYAESAYLAYAMSVVKGRALPATNDGQKPVQRRILYVMHDMGLKANSKPVKSARVVGEILGKYHPHGDSSAYEAMVRMAQDFTLRYPLVDGQGNFGSRDGDSAAAMRYTEARLTAISELLLGEIDEGTVNFVDNYDGAFTEPSELPSRMPFSLLNGASGIAVGMATEIPPHNIKDVANAVYALMENGRISVEELAKIIQAPDFPGGGTIISDFASIENAYSTGKGSVRVRAKYEFESYARGQWALIVTELPPGVSTQKVLEEIEDLVNPKLKVGKKTFSIEQMQTKVMLNGLLEKVRDDSDNKQPIRIIFEPKTSKIDKETFVKTIIALTSLEVNASINLVAVKNDGRPMQLNLKEMLQEWIDFRYECVRKRSEFRKNKLERKLHLEEGKQIAYANIEAVIEVIRNSKDPKEDLIKSFGFSPEQADYILDIRLRQLSRLEGFAIDAEIKRLKEELANLYDILSSRKKIMRVIRNEMSADIKKFGDGRRTEIKPSIKTSLERVIKDEVVVVSVTKNNWVRAGDITCRNGDSIAKQIETRTVSYIYAMGSSGRIYTIPVDKIVGLKHEGVPVTSLIDSGGDVIVGIIGGNPKDSYVFMSTDGYGFKCELSKLTTRQRSGKQLVTVRDDIKAITPVKMEKGKLHIFTDMADYMCIDSKEIPASEGGRGLQLAKIVNCTVMRTLVNSSKQITVRYPVKDRYKTSSVTVSVVPRASKPKPYFSKEIVKHILNDLPNVTLE